MPAAAAEGHGVDHNELIGSSVVSLGAHEKCFFRSVLPELGSCGGRMLNLHFGGRAAALLG